MKPTGKENNYQRPNHGHKYLCDLYGPKSCLGAYRDRMLSVIRDSMLNIWPVVIGWRAARMGFGWEGWAGGGYLCL